MADGTKVETKVRADDRMLSPRARELLAKFSSTVFACDISGDTRYIRCDFKQCSEHGQLAQGTCKPGWILNTLKNVRTLEKHVGKEVDQYMRQQPLEFDLSTSPHHMSSHSILDTKMLPPNTKKVVAVFNLKDPQSHFGEWVSLFMDAAKISEGWKEENITVITQEFVSRHQLIQCIANLAFLKERSPSVEVLAVLSCHSSSQGQVFSCTPSAISKQCGFEEFCSLHDFVMACQEILHSSLAAVHISSCFTLKLDRSHLEWPVDAEWLRTKLKCVLSGSKREVYETGSQVADLHLMLSATQPPVQDGTWGEQFKRAVLTASSESFPDLAREMGVEVVRPKEISTKLATPETDDKVTPPGLVLSSLLVVLLVEADSEPTPPSPKPAPGNPYAALAMAIEANLHMRQASDVRCRCTVLNIHRDLPSLVNTKSDVVEKLGSLQCRDGEVLFVALGAVFASPNLRLLQAIREWEAERAGVSVYGLHFQNISAMQAYFVKQELRKACAEAPERPLTVTGLVDNEGANCSAAFPVLLYVIHLAVGENGNRVAGKGIPSDKPVGRGNSTWTLDEVYMETCHVLSGLSRKCGLHLLSAPVPHNSSHLASPSTANRSAISRTPEGVETQTTVDSSRTSGVNIMDLQATTEGSVACATTVGISGLQGPSDDRRCGVVGNNGDGLGTCCDSANRSNDPNGATVPRGSPGSGHAAAMGCDAQESSHERDSFAGFSSVAAGSREKAFEISSGIHSSVSGHSALSDVRRGNATEVCQASDETLSEGQKVHSISENTRNTGKYSDATTVDGQARVGPDLSSRVHQQHENISKNSEKCSQMTASVINRDFLAKSNADDWTGSVSSSENAVEPKDCTRESSVDENGENRREAGLICPAMESKRRNFAATDFETMTSEGQGLVPGDADGKISGDASPTGKDSAALQPGGRISTLLPETTSYFGDAAVSAFTTSMEVDGQRTSCSRGPDRFTENKREHASIPESPGCDARGSEFASGSQVTSGVRPDPGPSHDARKRPQISEEGPPSEKKRPKLDGPQTSSADVAGRGSVDGTSMWDSSEDLPLMANVNEVLVTHYILDLSVDFDAKVMRGSIVLFLEPASAEVLARQFQLNLDSTLVNIESVSELTLPEDFKVTFRSENETKAADTATASAAESSQCQDFLTAFLRSTSERPLPFKGLSYSVYGWCVRIWKPGATGQAWPRCVYIKYNTSPQGQSLTWATDQEGRPCVFSPGAYINNRSLMPCQEPPVAMSTWQASIHVPKDCVVLMSGNPVGEEVASRHERQVTFSYEMSTPLPCSTLAVAVGCFTSRRARGACAKRQDGSTGSIACRMFAPPCLIDSAARELLECAPKFLEAACEFLGPYPFSRLDILIMPKCFACMGLKSPNLVFLSQSLLAGDGSMSIRLAHEISHAWFGLLVGAKDWTEEWLSEGFATYAEEKIQAIAEEWSASEELSFRQLKQILRRRTLADELQEADENQQCLRPKKKPSSEITDADANQRSHTSNSSPQAHTVVKNGQICSRKWSQVYYLKGYFLLHRMGELVGLEEFNQFLRRYVQNFKGQLVTSEDFFDFFLHSFSEIPWDTKDNFIKEWVDCPGMPKSVPASFPRRRNALISQVENNFQKWRKQDATNKRNTTMRVRRRKEPQIGRMDLSDQVVLLMEKLLEKDSLSHKTLRQLDKCYGFAGCNAEIRHRWCELVVKHKYTVAMSEVRRFLVEDQGMGIYLFGELLISGQPKQIAIVKEVLDEIGPEMDRCTYRTVQDMLLGND